MSTLLMNDDNQYNKDLQTLKSMALIAVNSQKYNADYNEATIMNIFLTAKSLGIDPMIALNGGFYIVKGKINMSAHFMVALARRKGHSIKVIEITDEKCVIIGQRKDNGDSIKYEYTWKDAVRAGLTNKQNWKDSPKSMLYAACVRTVFRMLFSDLGIAYDADEMNASIPNQEENAEDALGIEIPSVALPYESTEFEVSSSENQKDDRSKIEVLKNHLQEDGIDCSYLEEFIKNLSEKNKKSIDQILDSALIPQLLPKFKSAYTKELMKRDQVQVLVEE